jgi:hypothetical protein
MSPEDTPTLLAHVLESLDARITAMEEREEDTESVQALLAAQITETNEASARADRAIEALRSIEEFVAGWNRRGTTDRRTAEALVRKIRETLAPFEQPEEEPEEEPEPEPEE